MKNTVKRLSQAFMMIIAILGFKDLTTEPDEERGQITLGKKVTPGADLEICIRTQGDNPDDPCRVSIFNPAAFKEVFKKFPSVYEAIAYIRDGYANSVLYEAYMKVCRQDGPFDLELQNYYAMACVEGGETKFLKLEAVNSANALEQIQPQLIDLLGLQRSDNQVKVDVKMMNENEAKAFAGFVMKE